MNTRASSAAFAPTSNNVTVPVTSATPTTTVQDPGDDDYDSFWDDDNDNHINGSNNNGARAISARMPSVRELTAKIIKLERENFQLKLRVHLNSTRGTADPITVAAPKKSQRDFQTDREIQELRSEKDQLAMRLEQNKLELEREMKLKDQLIEREGQFLMKYTELTNYVDLVEKEKIALHNKIQNQAQNRWEGSGSGSGSVSGSGRRRSLNIITVSRAVGDSFPLDFSNEKNKNNLFTSNAFQGLSAEEWYRKYEQTSRLFQVTSKELKESQKECESVNSDRILLLKQLKTSEAIRRRESILMENRLKETLEKISKENKTLKMTNEELRGALSKADERAEVSKKAAVQEISSQLFYHQTALEKVHEEQGLLIAELQSLKKSCPIGGSSTATCGNWNGSGITSEFHALAHVPVTGASPTSTLGSNSPRFIRKPRVISDNTAIASVTDFQFQLYPGPGDNQQHSELLLKNDTQIDLELQPSKLVHVKGHNNGSLTLGLSNDNENEKSISHMNKKLFEKNSKLALKLKNTRESLKQAIALLENSEKDKEGMEKIICRQLHRTHIILADVKDTLVYANANSPSCNSADFEHNSTIQNQHHLQKQDHKQSHVTVTGGGAGLSTPNSNDANRTPKTRTTITSSKAYSEFRTKHKPFTI